MHIMSLKTYLNAALNQRGWTYTDLATRSGVHKMNITRVLGASQKPTKEPDHATLNAYAEALELPLYRLIEEMGYDLGFKEDDTNMKLARQIEDRPDVARLAELLIQLDNDAVLRVASYAEALKDSR